LLIEVGVTALTTSSIKYVNAQAVTVTPSPTPTPIPGPTTSSISYIDTQTPTFLSEEINSVPTNSNTSPENVKTLPPFSSVGLAQQVTTTPVSVGIVTTLYITTSGSSGLEILATITTLPPGMTTLPGSAAPAGGSYTTTFVETISGQLGVETLSVIATLPIGSTLGSYITTLVETTSVTGASGLATISEVTTLPIGSYILSFMGITVSAAASESSATGTTTSKAGGGSGAMSTSGATPVGFTGSATRPESGVNFLLVGFIVAALVLT
jgi:hypothetical protein